MSKPPAHEKFARAAFDLFDERGYEQTTVDDIAERAGLSRATFFRQYRSKKTSSSLTMTFCCAKFMTG